MRRLGAVRGQTLVTIVLTAALAFAGTGGALAAGDSATQQILSQCPSGHVSGQFTVAQLRQALVAMPASLKQYTSCPDVVQQALITARSKNGSAGSGGSGGSFLPTPVIVILVVLVLAAVTFGALAVRRRRGPGDPGEPGDPADR